MRTALRILGVILIFLFGVFVGLAGTRAAISKKAREVMLGGPDSIVEIVVKRLDSDLRLDPAQKRKLQTIADDAHIKLRQSHLKIQPEINATLLEAETRVREMLEVIVRVMPWAGGQQQAMAWYRAQPVAAWGDRTAESLVKEGKAAVVRDYLDFMAQGNFA